MKRWILSVIALLVLATPSMAAGLMKPKDSTLPDLEIERHDVRVTINNGFAVTEVDQVFRNPHDRDLDAIYTFPLPKDASLSELSLWIDGQEVMGEVVEKERARKIVENERAEGRETALAEQREYYSFDVFVSPVRAADTVRVRLLYLQPIEIDTGIGRYVYPLEEGRIDEEMHTFWDRREKVDGKFSFEAIVRSSYPLDDVRAKGIAQARITQDDPDTWRIWIDDEAGSVSLDQDVVIYYRLAQNQPARVDLLPFRGEGDGMGSFMVVVTPGMDLKPTSQGVDWTVVLDVSGSMSAKIATAAAAVTQALDQMRPEDRFRVIAFSNHARSVTGSWQSVTTANVETARRQIGALRAGNGTNMHAGLDAGLAGLDPDRPNAVILISDGGANVGPTEHTDFLKLLEKTDVRVFTFVMGQGSNRPLLDRLAEESNGFSLDVSNQDDLYGRIQQAKTKLGREALHGVKLEWKGGGIVDRTPRRLASVYYGQQIVAFGRYTKPGPVELRLAGRISGEEIGWETEFELPAVDERFPEIERLWAFASIDSLKREIDLGGDASELREAIVDLGTGYSIVSDYTSMVVVREERFEDLGIDRKNLRRTERERQARTARASAPPQNTRVDAAKPMFQGRSSHDGWGSGASGPLFFGLVSALLGARAWLGRRRSRRG